MSSNKEIIYLGERKEKGEGEGEEEYEDKDEARTTASMRR